VVQPWPFDVQKSAHLVAKPNCAFCRSSPRPLLFRVMLRFVSWVGKEYVCT
jgi:hypothetical protein